MHERRENKKISGGSLDLKMAIRPDKVRGFVQNNIKHRECCVYVRDDKKEREICKCGRIRESAVHAEQGDESQEWTANECTKQIEASSFGTIHFSGLCTENATDAPYVRIENDLSDTNMQTVWTLMTHLWRVKPPNLIISITGGANRFLLNHKIKASVKRGLVKCASSTGAWLITGGNETGVMKFVGKAVKEYTMTQGVMKDSLVALGIAAWGCIDNNKTLVGPEGQGRFPADYDVEALSHDRNVSPLDPNHTHFILVDDGSDSKFGREIKFRAKLEEYLSQNTAVTVKNKNADIPIVCLAIEGGEQTLETIRTAVESGTPVVIVNGSGRAADFIARAYEETKSKDASATVYPPEFDADFEAHASYMFKWGATLDPEVKQEKIQIYLEHLKTLLGYRQLITVVTMDDDDTTNDIDGAILQALIKSNKFDFEKELSLALAWNQFSVAKDQLLTAENSAKWQHFKYRGMLYDLLYTALAQDQIEFVQLFLDCGINLKRFLTVRRLRDLYNDTVIESQHPSASTFLIHSLIQNKRAHRLICRKREEISSNSPILLQHIGQLLNYLLRDEVQAMYQDEKFIVHDKKDEIDGDGSVSDKDKRADTLPSGTPDFTADFQNPARHLFLWALLLNRRELAAFFWKIDKDHIGEALAAAAILKSLAEEAKTKGELYLSSDIREHAREYEAHGVAVLCSCYSKDKELTHKLLTRDLKTGRGTTLLSMAYSAELMDFMEHTACQTKLDRIWTGRMASNTSLWRILLCLFLPVFLPLIQFHLDGTDSRCNFKIKGSENETKEQYLLNEIEENTPTKSNDANTKPTLVTCCFTCAGENNSVCWLCATQCFYSSPVVKFCFHTIFHIIFLILFSYFVMVELRSTPNITGMGPIEFVLWGWVLTFICEEIRQIVTRDPQSVFDKISHYFSSRWNLFDLVAHSIFALSIVLRFILDNDDFVYARIAYCFALLLYSLRLIQAFFFSANLGPKAVMIQRMIKDLWFFVCIVLVFILPYGVIVQALRYPNAKTSWSLLKDVVYMPYWQVYGELFLEDLQGDVNVGENETVSCATDPHHADCPKHSGVVIFLLAVYMLITNVLLLNLLIAMFSYTFDKVQEKSKKMWRFYRYSLISEYYDRPALAPPLILINHIVRFVKYIARKFQGRATTSHKLKNVYDDDEDHKFTSFERLGKESYLYSKNVREKDLIDNKVQDTKDRLEEAITQLERMKEYQQHLTQDLKAIKENIPLSLRRYSFRT